VPTLSVISLRDGSTKMYESELAKKAKRLRIALNTIEEACFEKVEGLRELYPQLKRSDRQNVMRH